MNDCHIVLVTPSFPKKDGKGYEKIAYFRIKELKRVSKVTVYISLPFHHFKKIDLPTVIDEVRYIYFKPDALDIFLCILRVACGLSIINSIFYNRKMIARLKKSKAYGFTAIYYCTSRCVHRISSINIPKVVDFVDSAYLNFSRKAENQDGVIGKWFWRLEAYRSKRHESSVALQSQLCICVSSIDSAIIGINKVKTIPLGLEISPLYESNQVLKGSIVFSGNLSYEPNISAATWFLENCWSEILKRVPLATFHIVGRGSSAEFINLINSFENVRLVGEVYDMEVELRKYCLAIAPMVSGSGMQFKILEAMAVGLPVITTKIGLGDIKADHLKNIVVSDRKSDVVDAAVRLLSEPKFHETIGMNGYDFVKSQHSWSKVRDELLDTMKIEGII